MIHPQSRMPFKKQVSCIFPKAGGTRAKTDIHPLLKRRELSQNENASMRIAAGLSQSLIYNHQRGCYLMLAHVFLKLDLLQDSFHAA